MHTIGIDIGGTHTDGVLLDAFGKSKAYEKTTTTSFLSDGVKTLLISLLKNSSLATDKVGSVVIGTTHATNAILEGKDLLKVGLLRLIDGKPQFPSPGFGWPDFLKQQILAGYETCEGGYECDGRASLRFNSHELKCAINRLLEKGCEAISVVGSFSPINGEQELVAESLIKSIAGKEFPVTLSHQIGGIGFIERENAALLNSSLKRVISKGFASMECVLRKLNIQAPLWLTQNNGSLLMLEDAIQFPIKTLGAGPTNSFIGATRLCSILDAIVVDMGGTSTDIGIVESGYARSSLHAAKIGGISLNFSMPDMISLSLGGGSHIVKNKSQKYQIGPQSVARDIKSFSKIFGGPILTLTDAGVAAGLMEIEDGISKKIGLSKLEAEEIIKDACRQIYQAIVRLRGRRLDLPVILAGGGSFLLQPLLRDFGLKGWIPHEASVANAFGAGYAEVSSVIDVVVSLNEREKVLEELKEKGKMEAIKNGVDPKNVRIAGLTILPFAYTQNSLAKVMITTTGPRLTKN